jgi:opacity protein-like surface antigen
MKTPQVLLIMGILLILAVPAAAKEGFYLGASFGHDKMLNSDFGSLNSAVGLNFKAGYDFGPLSLEGNIIGSKHDDRRPGYGDSKFGGLSIDFRVPFLQPGQQNQLFVLAGVGAYSLSGYDPTANAEVKYTGGGFDLGAGVEHFFNEHLAFDLTAVYRAIKYGKQEAQGTTASLSPKLNGDVLSIQAGISYHF